jgi:hypothetical protein
MGATLMPPDRAVPTSLTAPFLINSGAPEDEL